MTQELMVRHNGHWKINVTVKPALVAGFFIAFLAAFIALLGLTFLQ